MKKDLMVSEYFCDMCKEQIYKQFWAINRIDDGVKQGVHLCDNCHCRVVDTMCLFSDIGTTIVVLWEKWSINKTGEASFVK